MSTCKVYVEVTAKFSKDGRLIPLSVRWQDGHVYEIQRITDICRGMETCIGTPGKRTCKGDFPFLYEYKVVNEVYLFRTGRSGTA